MALINTAFASLAAIPMEVERGVRECKILVEKTLLRINGLYCRPRGLCPRMGPEQEKTCILLSSYPISLSGGGYEA
jgi:hypothetical protein